jgi:voltage-gated sodium channel
VLNLFIGVVVSAMQKEHDEQAASDRATLHDDQTAILEELGKLRAEIRALRGENAS